MSYPNVRYNGEKKKPDCELKIIFNPLTLYDKISDQSKLKVFADKELKVA